MTYGEGDFRVYKPYTCTRTQDGGHCCHHFIMMHSCVQRLVVVLTVHAVLTESQPSGVTPPIPDDTVFRPELPPEPSLQTPATTPTIRTTSDSATSPLTSASIISSSAPVETVEKGADSTTDSSIIKQSSQTTAASSSDGQSTSTSATKTTSSHGTTMPTSDVSSAVANTSTPDSVMSTTSLSLSPNSTRIGTTTSSSDPNSSKLTTTSQHKRNTGEAVDVTDVTTRDHRKETPVTLGNTVNSTSSIQSETTCIWPIALVVGVAVAVTASVLLASGLVFIRQRRKWKKKIKDERLKTDIWTMSTFNNTIVNDNFMDYSLAPSPLSDNQPDDFFYNNQRVSSSFHPKTMSFSSQSRDYVHGPAAPVARRGSLKPVSSEGSLHALSKSWVKRSNAGSDVTLGEPVEGRSRTSSSLSGRKILRRSDTHVLVDNDELHKSQEDLRTAIEFFPHQMRTQNRHIFTEL